MKLAFCSQEYPLDKPHGGIGTQTHAKAHGLAALGHEVHVITTGTPARQELTTGDVHVIRIPGFESVMPVHTDAAWWLTYSAMVAAEVAALHRKVTLDVVDFAEWGGEGYVHLLNRTEWNRVTSVVHLHGPATMVAQTLGWPARDSELYRLAEVMEGACVRLADAVMSSSSASAQWCARMHGIDAALIPTLHTGVDTERFRPRPGSAGRAPVVIFVGRVTHDKGADTLVRACCLLAREFPGLRVRLVGKSDEGCVRSIREAVAAAGMPHMVEIVGPVAHEHLPEELARADIFAAPSRFEAGPGIAWLEAMACGLPAVACAGSGVAEVIEHGRTGLLVPEDDAEALAEVLRMLLRDEHRRAELGRAARACVEREADTRVCMRRLEQFYLGVRSRTDAHSVSQSHATSPAQ